MRQRGLCLTIAIVAVVGIGEAALAADSRVLSDDWYVTVGGYLAELSTDASVGTGGVIGTVIRAEEELGLDDQKSTFQLVAERRFGRRHSLGLKYFDISRSGDTELGRTIEFQGNTYEAGVFLASQFDTTLIQLNYRYSFINDGKTEAGLQAGLSTWSLSTELAGEATIESGSGSVSKTFVSADEDVLAPVPSAGIFLRHAFNERLVLQASAGFLRLTLGDIEARVVETSFTLDWFFSRHVGAGVGFGGTDMRYEDAGEDPLRVEYRQNGAVGYLSLVF